MEKASWRNREGFTRTRSHRCHTHAMWVMVVAGVV